jgi:hypothetical protein
MVDISTVKALHRRLEPLHAFVYFSPEASLRYAALGLDGQAGYFASRSAAMGRVGSEVVIATFFNFKPDLVRDVLPATWDVVSPEQLLEARMLGADETLRRVLGDLIEDPTLMEVAELTRTAALACAPAGRPLFAAHAALPWPDEPHMIAFHAVTLLREHRGDGHVAALTLENLTNVEVLVTHAASEEFSLPEEILQLTRGFSDEEWEAAKGALRGRGLLDDDGNLTVEGIEMRQRVEDRTDVAALQPWEALGQESCDQLLELARPFTRAVMKSGIFSGDLNALRKPT